MFSTRDDDLVVLASFDNSPAAHSVRLLLESNGISATVVNEESATNLGATLFGQMGLIKIEICVLRADFEAAKLIVSEVPQASEVLIPEWTCHCGETVDAGFSVCWSCGKEYREPDGAGNDSGD